MPILFVHWTKPFVGYPWHITVIKNYTRKDSKLVLETTCYVSIVEKSHPQEAGSVAAIIYEVRLSILFLPSENVDIYLLLCIGFEAPQTIT